MKDYYSLLWGAVLLGTMSVLLILGIWFRVQFAQWFKGHMEHTPALLPWGRQKAANASTPGQMLFVCIAGFPIIGVIACNLIPKVWEAPYETARASLILCLVGGVLMGLAAIAIASYFPLHAPRSVGPARIRGGIILAMGGFLLLGIVVQLAP